MTVTVEHSHRVRTQGRLPFGRVPRTACSGDRDGDSEGVKFRLPPRGGTWDRSLEPTRTDSPVARSSTSAEGSPVSSGSGDRAGPGALVRGERRARSRERGGRDSASPSSTRRPAGRVELVERAAPASPRGGPLPEPILSTSATNREAVGRPRSAKARGDSRDGPRVGGRVTKQIERGERHVPSVLFFPMGASSGSLGPRDPGAPVTVRTFRAPRGAVQSPGLSSWRTPRRGPPRAWTVEACPREGGARESPNRRDRDGRNADRARRRTSTFEIDDEVGDRREERSA